MLEIVSKLFKTTIILKYSSVFPMLLKYWSKFLAFTYRNDE